MLHKYLLNERLKDSDQNRAWEEQEERKETKEGGGVKEIGGWGKLN